VRNHQAPDPIKEATLDALKHVVDSLLELMFDAGITVQQFNYVVRDRAVRAAGNRVIRETGRNSKSRVSIITGIPRSEVARISGSPDYCVSSKLSEPVARRVLGAWFESPQLLTASGEPIPLPIFGKKRSFESLVAQHGAGVPVRALLDELLQIEALERLPGQRVRVKSRVPVSIGSTPSAIGAIGERCSDLIETLTKNVRRTKPPLFQATSSVQDADPNLIPVLRREIAQQGRSFISSANSLLKRSQRRTGKTSLSPEVKCRVGVTVYYFEDPVDRAAIAGKAVNRSRTNLRRTRKAQ